SRPSTVLPEPGGAITCKCRSLKCSANSSSTRCWYFLQGYLNLISAGKAEKVVACCPVKAASAKGVKVVSMQIGESVYQTNVSYNFLSCLQKKPHLLYMATETATSLATNPVGHSD